MKENNKCQFCNNGFLVPYFGLNKNSLKTMRCTYCKLVIVCNTPINTNNISLFYSMEAYKGKRDLQDNNKYINYYSNCYINYNKNDLTIKQFNRLLMDINNNYLNNKPIKLLDIGCATGVFLDLARSKGYLVYGIEISKDLSEYAKKEFKLKIKNDLVKASYPANKFDVITLLDVIEHFPCTNFEIMINEINRILKPSGLLIIRTPSEDALLRKIAKFIFYATFKKIEAPMHLFYSYEHILNFSPNSLSLALKRYGFKQIYNRREDENPDRLNINIIEKLILKLFFLISRIMHKQHKFIQFYIKS